MIVLMLILLLLLLLTCFVFKGNDSCHLDHNIVVSLFVLSAVVYGRFIIIFHRTIRDTGIIGIALVTGKATPRP